MSPVPRSGCAARVRLIYVPGGRQLALMPMSRFRT
jgi:hypothetical protein